MSVCLCTLHFVTVIGEFDASMIFQFICSIQRFKPLVISTNIFHDKHFMRLLVYNTGLWSRPWTNYDDARLVNASVYNPGIRPKVTGLTNVA